MKRVWILLTTEEVFLVEGTSERFAEDAHKDER
jgi:hypothetical protein